MGKSEVQLNIRIRKVKLTDFRNIQYAEIDIPNGKTSDYINGGSSVLGIYGQNGSGKTSLLLALKALKTALSGDSFIYPQFASCIRAGCDSALLGFEFSAYNDRGDEFDFYYSFRMRKTDEGIELDFDPTEFDEGFDDFAYGKIISEKGRDSIYDLMFPKDKRIEIYDEVLQFACKTQIDGNYNKQILIDTSEKARKTTGKTFGNKKKYEQMTRNYEGDIDDQLYRIAIRSSIESTSCIFRYDFCNAIYKGCSEELYSFIIHSLRSFGRYYLFVRLTDDVNNNELMPTIILSTWSRKRNAVNSYSKEYHLILNDHASIPEEEYEDQKESIESISKVLSQIVPGLSIELEDCGQFLSENRNKLHSYNIVSSRNGVRIPLRFESDGIKRMLSFLSLLIAAYNEPSMTIAIDEIDSGVFEYMLGELLTIMKNSAKGQLIFTSHNLRPLETLSYRNLLFTTINSRNRFAKIDGISGNNNLRDSYFRNIVLGDGENALYSYTDSFSIEQAFIEAGLPKES